jgi:hypothetical protein
LNPFGLVLAGDNTGPASAAVIAEQLLNKTAPRAAIQNANPFNVAHPEAITTFGEQITGFTSQSAESLFYSRGLPSLSPPQSVVNGRPVPEVVSSTVNDSAFAVPNDVTTYSLPSSDTPAEVMVTVKSGATVIGFNFEGGSALSLADVQPIIQKALAILAASCNGIDIMPRTAGS